MRNSLWPYQRHQMKIAPTRHTNSKNTFSAKRKKKNERHRIRTTHNREKWWKTRFHSIPKRDAKGESKKEREHENKYNRRRRHWMNGVYRPCLSRRRRRHRPRRRQCTNVWNAWDRHDMTHCTLVVYTRRKTDYLTVVCAVPLLYSVLLALRGGALCVCVSCVVFKKFPITFYLRSWEY